MVTWQQIKLTAGSIPSTESFTHSCPCVKFKPPQILGTASQDVPIDRLSGKGVRPFDSTYLDLYVQDGKGSRFSQMSPKCSGMLSPGGNLLSMVKLHNIKEKYGTPFLRVDRITSDLYAMEATSMTLISERATFIPQVRTLAGVISQYPQALSPLWWLTIILLCQQWSLLTYLR